MRSRRRRLAEPPACCRSYAEPIPSLLVLIFEVSVLVMFPSSAVAQTETCGDGSLGYASLASLNSQIDADAAEVAAGEPPRSMYLYRICPGARFDFGGQNRLRPRLDGSVFQCGDGPSGGDCRFQGGDDQVVIDQPGAEGGTILSDVRFQGITFTDFTNSAIRGSADSGTKVTLEDTIFAVRFHLACI